MTDKLKVNFKDPFAPITPGETMILKKRIKQLEQALIDQSLYWSDWNRRASQRNMELESVNQDLQAELNGYRCYEPSNEG